MGKVGKYEKTKDEDLVKLVFDNQEVYQELVKRYQSKLMRYAVFLVKDKDKAEDVVQEAFIKAFKNLRSFNTKKKFSSWIYRIVHNEAINNLKKYKREVSLDDNEWLQNSLVSTHNIERDFHQKEQQQIFRENLNHVTDKYKEPMILFYVEQKSYKEISEILRMPINTVGTRITRGKKIITELCQSQKKN